MSKFTLCVTFLLRQQQKGLVRKKKRSAKQTEMGNLQEFHSEKLEELMCLEKSVPQISSVAFKFGKKNYILQKSFQPFPTYIMS